MRTRRKRKKRHSNANVPRSQASFYVDHMDNEKKILSRKISVSLNALLTKSMLRHNSHFFLISLKHTCVTSRTFYASSVQHVSHASLNAMYVSISTSFLSPFPLFFIPLSETVNSQWARHTDQSRDPSLSGLYVPRVGIGKTKHMLIVSQGVHSVSCSLKVSHTTAYPSPPPTPTPARLVAANSQLCFSGPSVRLHLAFEDTWIPKHCSQATHLCGDAATIWAVICQPYSFSRSK